MPSGVPTLYAQWKDPVPEIKVATQTGTVTYGTGATPTYAVTASNFGAGIYPTFAPSIAWVGTAPTGVTPAFSGTNNETLTMTTTAETLAGDYKFKVVSPKTGGGNYESTEATLRVDKLTASIAWGEISFPYNGSPQVPTATVDNKIGSDDVTVTVTGEQTNTGNYTATATALTGAAAVNYALPTTGLKPAFAITAKPVTVTGATSVSVTKVYDGNPDALASAVTGTLGLDGVIGGDTSKVSAKIDKVTYADANAGKNKNVTLTISLDGTAKGNYALDKNTVTVSGEITAKPVTTLNDGTLKIIKEYDAKTSAGTATGALDSVDFVATDKGNVSALVTDVGAYPDTTVGQNKTVSLKVALDGSAKGNYSLADATYSFTKAEITKARPKVDVTTATVSGAKPGTKDDTFTLTATVTGVGSDKPGGTIQFKADGGTNIGGVLTLNNGVATYDWVTPDAGNYTITAEFVPTGEPNYTDTTGSVELTVSKAGQAALTFTAPTATTVTYGDSAIDFTVDGGTGSGAVSYASSNPAKIAISGTQGTIKGIGTVTITATKAADKNYNETSAAKDLTVNPATPIVTWANTTQSLGYTGSAAAITAPTVTLKNSETIGKDQIQYAYKKSGFAGLLGYKDGLPTDAGSYTIKANLAKAGNYTAADSTNELTLTITKSTPTLTIDNGYTGKTYDGAAMSAPIDTQMTINGASFTDVKFAYSVQADMSKPFSAAPKNAGTYYVQASVAENHNTAAVISAAKEFIIAQKALTISGAIVTPRQYDGTTTAAVTGLTFNGLVTGETVTINTDYTVGNPTYDSAAAGTRTVTGTASLVGNAKTDNYILTGAYTIPNQTIAKKTGIGAPTFVKMDDVNNTFTFGTVSGYATVTDYEWKLERDATWTSVTANPILVGDKAGKIQIRIKETPNYEAGATYTHKDKFTAALAGSVAISTYSGVVRYGETLTATVSGQQEGAELHYSWSDGTHTFGTDSDSLPLTGPMIGKTITVTVTAADYSGELTATTTTVAKKTAALVVTDGVDKEYDGNEQAKLTLSIRKVNGDDDITITAPKAVYADKNVGNNKTITINTLTITGAAKDWYEVTPPATSTNGNITAKVLSVTATVTDKDYDGTTNATATYKVTGKLATDTVTASGTATFEDAHVGTGKTVNITNITLSGADKANYKLNSTTATTQATIRKATVTPTIAPIAAQDYNGSQIKPTPTVTIAGTTPFTATDYTVTYGSNVDAGTGTVTVKADKNGNYTFADVTANFTINKITYNSTAITGTKLVKNTTAQTGVTFDLSTLSFPTGFKDNDFKSVVIGTNTDNVLTGTPSITSGITGKKLTFDVGAVAANLSGTMNMEVSSKNYHDYTVKITVTTVDKTPLTITGTAATGLIYNGSAQSGYTKVAVEGNRVPVKDLDFTYSGKEKNNTAYGPTTTAPTGAGDYQLVVSVKDTNTTYAGKSSALIFSIEQKELTVKADNKTMTKGAAVPPFTVTNSGFLGTDTAATAFATQPVATCTADGTSIGTFDILIRTKAVLNTGVGANYFIKSQDKGTLTVNAVSHTITASAGTGGTISPSGTVSVKDGANQTFSITPSSNYKIASVTVDGTNQGAIGSYTFTNVIGAHTIAATFSHTGGSTPSGDGGHTNDSSSGSTATTPPSTGVIQDQTNPAPPTTAQSETTANVDSNGNASATLTDQTMQDAIDRARKEAERQGTAGNGIAVEIHVTTGGRDVNTMLVNLPETLQEKIIESRVLNTILVMDRPDISLNMNLATITEINRQAKSDVQLIATRVDSSILSGEAKRAIAGRPTYDLRATYNEGTRSIHSFRNGSMTVAIPYLPQKGEVAGGLYGVYVNDKKANYITNSSYDEATQKQLFATNQLGVYGIGYKAPIGFTDIKNHWAKADIEFGVSRGLLNGTRSKKFAPNSEATHGMFATALGRMANTDVSGILTGNADQRIADTSITHEQMAVMLYHYTQAIGYTLPIAHVEKSFADSHQISPYARDVIKAMQMAGILNGKSGNVFDPQGIATKAEASAMLHRFIELVITTESAQGWVKNDSGKWMYYENGKAVTGNKIIGAESYLFDRYGEMVDALKK
ncbi:MAG: YDG domain-containing protein [Lachnospiraceae bacterium]